MYIREFVLKKYKLSCLNMFCIDTCRLMKINNSNN